MLPINFPRMMATALPRRVILAVAALLLTAALPEDAVAQFDFLQSLFGRRQATPTAFTGQQQLSQARVEAERGDVQKSAALVREALQTVTAPVPPGDPMSQSIAAQVIELSRMWSERQAPPELVAEVLRDVVLPPKSPAEVRPYALPWQSNFQSWNSLNSSLRDPQPRSVAGELVTWSLRAKQTAIVRTRLDAARKSSQAPLVATVLSAQLAVVERDDATANR
ncbi:MAG TPA: hypothetical protein VM165_07210, partial [Planctomycetaceae bacterium]|nr:hypothetical protein [Planctomycetaceae bacterium]